MHDEHEKHDKHDEPSLLPLKVISLVLVGTISHFILFSYALFDIAIDAFDDLENSYIFKFAFKSRIIRNKISGNFRKSDDKN